MMELAEIDRAILRLMQQDSSITITALADRIGLSASAARRRLQRLRDEKIIARDVSIVDPRKVGAAVSLLVELELERDRPELLAPLHRWIAENANIRKFRTSVVLKHLKTTLQVPL